MQVVIIKRVSSRITVAILEAIPGFSKEATALAWAKSIGHDSLPDDLYIDGMQIVITAGSTLLALMPCVDIERIKEEAKR